LLDLMMPRMPGMEVSERLRADPLTAAIPIIVMSAGTSLSLFARHLPVNGQLAKPFDLDDLYAVVERCVQTQCQG
jgi:CheY-like chemotaxis protein